MVPLVGVRAIHPAPVGLPKTGDDLKTPGLKGRATVVPSVVVVPKARKRLDGHEDAVRPFPVNQGVAPSTRVPGAILPGVELVRVPTGVTATAGHQVQAERPPFHATPRVHAVRPLAQEAPVAVRVGVGRLAGRGAAGGLSAPIQTPCPRARTATDGVGVAVGAGGRVSKGHRHGAIPAIEGGAPVKMGRPEAGAYGGLPGPAHADAPVTGRVINAARDVAPDGSVAAATFPVDGVAGPAP